MSMEVAYYAASANKNMPGAIVGSEASVTLSSTSARTTNATPTNADFVAIVVTEAARIDYSSATSTAGASSAYLAAGERMWLDAKAGYKVAGRTA